MLSKTHVHTLHFTKCWVKLMFTLYKVLSKTHVHTLRWFDDNIVVKCEHEFYCHFVKCEHGFLLHSFAISVVFNNVVFPHISPRDKIVAFVPVMFVFASQTSPNLILNNFFISASFSYSYFYLVWGRDKFCGRFVLVIAFFIVLNDWFNLVLLHLSYWDGVHLFIV